MTEQPINARFAINVQHSDALTFPADVLAVRYWRHAQGSDALKMLLPWGVLP